jgi:LCP family protein required for cell wall assembly
VIDLRLSGTVKTCTILSFVVILLSAFYFNFFMPFWNFMVEAELDDMSNKDIDPIVSFDLQRPTKSPDNSTPEPGTTPGPSEEPVEVPVVEEGTLNVLILGADDAASLVDTIIVVNVNVKTKEIKLISIPRDAYVPYDNTIRERMSQVGFDTVKGAFKINAAPYVGEKILNYQGGKFENKGISFLCDIIELMLGYKIDEYIHVNFEGFVEIVDLFGGIKVTAPENIYNNKGELIIKEGLNELDGKTALFYARARYRYDEFGNNLPSSGDPYRKANQLNMLKEVASQIVTIQNVARAKDILNSLKKNVHHSVTMGELPEYSVIALDYANGLYTVETVLIKGKNIDPFGDHASYVDILN